MYLGRNSPIQKIAAICREIGIKPKLLFQLAAFLVTLCIFRQGFLLLSYKSSVEKVTRRPIAICLAGGLRSFELTGPSIQMYLLSTYGEADVFIMAPKDKDSWKIHYLNGKQVVAVRIFKQERIPEGNITDTVIHQQGGSPTGVQGLLQYFALVEGCNELIERYELLHQIQYQWILRTRPDGLWSSRPPTLESLSLSKYYIPPGSDWWGINDRLGLGNRVNSRNAMTWLSSIPSHLLHGHHQLTSEEAFMHLLESENISPVVVRKVSFPFCVVTRRIFRYPPRKKYGGPVAPIGSSSAVNGAYCRPCKHEKNPKVLKQIPMHLFNMTEFCDTSINWVSGWEKEFDLAVVPSLANIRKLFHLDNNFFACIKKLSSFLNQVELWDGGFTVREICTLAFQVGNESQLAV